MPELTLAQPIEGGMPDDVVDIPAERAEWYKANGYAYDPTDDSNKLLNTSVPRSQDPTLAENREGPNEPLPEGDPTPGESDTMALGGDPGDFTVSEVVAYLETADEVERTRVIDAEIAGKNRAGITGWTPPEV